MLPIADIQAIESSLDELPDHTIRALVKAQLEIGGSSLDIQKTMENIVQLAQSVLPCEGVVVELLEGDEMVYRATSGSLARHIGLRLPARGSISGLCVEMGELLQSDDTETDPRVDRAACRRTGIRSMLVSPLRYRTRTVGVLKAASSRPNMFSAIQAQVLRVLAVNLSAALAHSEEFSKKEQRLLEREAQLSVFIENAPAAIAMFDREMRYLVASREWVRDFGIPSDHEGRSHYELRPETPERWREIHRRALAGASIHCDQEEFRRADGRAQWLSWDVRPWFNSEGAPGGILVATSDITQVKNAEEELRRSEALLTAITTSITDPIYAKNFEGRGIFLNPACAELIGKPPELILGRTQLEWSPEPVETSMRAMKLDHDLMVADKELILEQTFRDRVYLTTKSPLKSASGQVVGLVSVSRDITERKRHEMALRHAKDELEAAIRARDEFLSICSHELKTPLTSLRIQAQVLDRLRRQGSPDAYRPQQVDRLLDHALNQSWRINRLVEDMLDVARIRSGKLTIRPEPLALAPLLEEVVERSQEALKQADIKVQLKIETRAEGQFDRLRIEQVIGNLLSNAMKYGEGRPVLLRLYQEGNRARLLIRDQGRGIEPEAQERIFRIFERNISVNEVSGLGLGLYIARQIIEAHGGRIWARSEGPGQGSEFVIDLPVDATVRAAVNST